MKTDRPMRKASLSAGRLALGHLKASEGLWSAATLPSWSISAAQVCASSGVMVSLVQPYVLSQVRRSSEGSELQLRAPAFRSSFLSEVAPLGAFLQSLHQLWIM